MSREMGGLSRAGADSAAKRYGGIVSPGYSGVMYILGA